MKNEVVFQCRKCEHLLFVKQINKTKLKNIMKMDCPSCGEEGYTNWVLFRMGNYEEEYGARE
jgi:DNA-directed RNA polymerase subunit M/transcription elongation factor TFIIS